jgi:hypothetical protein
MADDRSKDLAPVLGDWPYDPDGVTVRLIDGDDGRSKVQMRVDMGLIQMELDGRPDGTRPAGCESWMEYYQQRKRAHDELRLEEPFVLDEEACERLWREGVQYYHRYLSCWHLKMYGVVARDTARNLELFALVRQYADDERNRLQFDQWRPYVIMMHTRAVATPLAEQGEWKKALRCIETGIDGIEEFLEAYDQTERASELAELGNLRQWREEIVEKLADHEASRPKSRVEQLEEELQSAVEAEHFERAAELRDEIRRQTSMSERS